MYPAIAIRNVYEASDFDAAYRIRKFLGRTSLNATSKILNATTKNLAEVVRKEV